MSNHTVSKIEFIVSGKPVPYTRMTQGQIKAMKNKRYGHQVNRQAQRYLEYKDAVGWQFKELYAGFDPMTGDVTMCVDVFLHEFGKRRWDASNVLKGIEDALNGLAYGDDKQIVSSQIRVWPSYWQPGEDESRKDYLRIEIEEAT